MKIAIEGCAHGELDNIYATLQHLERVENTKIDLLICCGDFQAVRNEDDLDSLACPDKYKAMNSFWKYYSGEETAPYPTLFIGGNHEASNYLWELYYGGWAAPRIYFLGFAGVIRFGGLRIGGLSGIYKPQDYCSGHYERVPYNSNDIRSIYHVRQYDVHKLLQIEDPMDIFISHDWPRGITRFGDSVSLLRHKPFLEKEVKNNTLGSKPGEQLLQKLKPLYWVSAHLHTKFAALVQHDDGHVTRFLALDKCLPNRNFLQVIELSTDDATHEDTLNFSYDEEWLAITRAYNPFLPLSRSRARLVTPQEAELMVHREWVQKHICERGGAVPSDFSVTVPPHNPMQARWTAAFQVSPQNGHVRNPCTEAFLQLLGLPYILDGSSEFGSSRQDPGLQIQETVSGRVLDPNEVLLDDGIDDEDVLPDDVDELEAVEQGNQKDLTEIPLDYLDSYNT